METYRYGKEVKALANEITRFVSDSINLEHESRYTTIQFLIMDYIGRYAEKKPVYQRDLELEFNIRRSTATGILQILEKNCLIKRSSCSQDARLKEIKLTETGQELFETRKLTLTKIEKTLTANIDSKDLVSFQKVIQQFYDNIAAAEAKIKK